MTDKQMEIPKDEKQVRKKIFFKINKNLLPQSKDRYPYIYIEHARIEIDDSSVKMITNIPRIRGGVSL